ncbi:MAG: hypothetical protein IAF08_08120 [Rhizobacter sp.]|nr:hypothetical protein [Chlorobiales bacterium]
MPLYKVSLSQTFIVTIEAANPNDAARMTEFFVGVSDLSTLRERTDGKFSILEIDMMQNDATETEEIVEADKDNK